MEFISYNKFYSGGRSDSRRYGLLPREREENPERNFVDRPDDVGNVCHVAGRDPDRRNVAGSHRVIDDVLKSGQFSYKKDIYNMKSNGLALWNIASFYDPHFRPQS